MFGEEGLTQEGLPIFEGAPDEGEPPADQPLDLPAARPEGPPLLEGIPPPEAIPGGPPPDDEGGDDDG